MICTHYENFYQMDYLQLQGWVTTFNGKNKKIYMFHLQTLASFFD